MIILFVGICTSSLMTVDILHSRFLSNRSELKCSIWVSSSCFTSDTHIRVILAKNPVISHKRRKKNGIVATTN